VIGEILLTRPGENPEGQVSNHKPHRVRLGLNREKDQQEMGPDPTRACL